MNKSLSNKYALQSIVKNGGTIGNILISDLIAYSNKENK